MAPIPRHPFRAAVIRGFAALLPPLLTLVVLIWVVNTTKTYFLEPVTAAARDGFIWIFNDVYYVAPPSDVRENLADSEGRSYHRLESGEYVPAFVYEKIIAATGRNSLPTDARDAYGRYVDLTFLRPYYAIPIFTAIFILVLYFMGKLFAIGLGGYFFGAFEGGVRRLPLVRNVYSASKQISDFIFSERDFEFTRIVAVEYPRKGVWSIGFVTSEGVVEVRDVVGEPIVAVMIPASPVPVTGVTIMVRKSECIDLNVTFDQACEFVVSCGVVLPTAKIAALQQTPSSSVNDAV